MKIKSRRFYLKLAVISLFIAQTVAVYPKSTAEKAKEGQAEILNYFRELRPMVYNFPCEPYPECKNSAAQIESYPRVKEFIAIRRMYQEGAIFTAERDYVNAYMRFVECQKRIELLFEEISQSYLDRTGKMMRDSLEKKEPDKDRPDDITFMDITIDYAPQGRLRKDFEQNREAPNEQRRYDPLMVHYMNNKFRIEKNVEKGYEHLSIARDTRVKALAVDANLAPQQKIDFDQRKKRIEYYLQSIEMSRKAKLNAETIYNLKYPYDNYEIDNLPDQNIKELVSKNSLKAEDVPEIDGVKMGWVNNPYYSPKKRHPIFNLSVPEEYRVDTVDLRKMLYDDEISIAVRFRTFKQAPTDVISDKKGGKNAGQKSNAPPAGNSQPAAPAQ